MLNDALKIALEEYGNKGIPGSNSNTEILKYYKNTGFDWVQDDDIAWCTAFISWCLMKAKKPYIKSLLARDYLKYGKKTQEPKLGDIAVLWRITRNSIYGHVGFFIRKDKNTVYLLGGNQNNSVTITPYPATQVLEYRKIV